MNRKISRAKSSIALILLATTLLACDLGLGNLGQISFGAPTPSSTRTPRPTFTVRVDSPTPEDTATPTATDTPARTVTNTRAPVVVARTATKPPAPPPPPSLPFVVASFYGCDMDNVWEVVGSVRPPGQLVALGGYVIAMLTPGGGIVKKSISEQDFFVEMSVSCQRTGNSPQNWKLDWTEYRGKGQYLIRMIKSENDPTPLSPPVPIDTNKTGRTYIFFDAQK